jgi:hypothetical protein
MIESNLGFDSAVSAGSVTELQRQFPHLPAKVLVTLAVMAMLTRTVTPFRLCACGCGESVHGKARLHSMACRQRVSRQRRAIRAASGRQFNLVIQYEIPVPIPTVPPPPVQGSAPGGDVLTVRAHRVTPFRDGQTILVTGYNHGARRSDGSEPYEVVFNYNEAGLKVRRFKDCADAEAKLGIKIDWSEFCPATRASHTSQNYSANCNSWLF